MNLQGASESAAAGSAAYLALVWQHFAADGSIEDFICGSTGPIRKLGLGENFQYSLERDRTFSGSEEKDGHGKGKLFGHRLIPVSVLHSMNLIGGMTADRGNSIIIVITMPQITAPIHLRNPAKRQAQCTQHNLCFCQACCCER